MTRDEYTAQLRRHLRMFRGLRYALVPMFGVNVFCAAYYIVSGEGAPFQLYAVVANLSAAVLGWDSAKRNQQLVRWLRAMLALPTP